MDKFVYFLFSRAHTFQSRTCEHGLRLTLQFDVSVFQFISPVLTHLDFVIRHNASSVVRRSVPRQRQRSPRYVGRGWFSRWWVWFIYISYGKL